MESVPRFILQWPSGSLNLPSASECITGIDYLSTCRISTRFPNSWVSYYNEKAKYDRRVKTQCCILARIRDYCHRLFWKMKRSHCLTHFFLDVLEKQQRCILNYSNCSCTSKCSLFFITANQHSPQNLVGSYKSGKCYFSIPIMREQGKQVAFTCQGEQYLGSLTTKSQL